MNHVKNIMEILMFLYVICNCYFVYYSCFGYYAEISVFMCLFRYVVFSLYEIYGLRRKLDLITVYVCVML